MKDTEIFPDFLKAALAWARDQADGGRHLRPLILAVSALTLIVILIAANSALKAASLTLSQAQSELTNLSNQLSEGSWEERRRQSDALRVKLSDRFWKAETAGLAEATLERWLRDRADKYGVKPDSIRIQRSSVLASGADEPGKSSLKGVQRMTAKMILPFEPQAVLQLLDDVARHDKILISDRLFIRSGRNATVEVDFSTFIRLDEPVR